MATNKTEGMQIVLEGRAYELDDFTLGEVEWIEDALGATLDQINPYSIKAAIHFVTVIRRRDDPEFTIDDARKLKLSVFEPDEQPADGATAKTRRPTRRAAA